MKERTAVTLRIIRLLEGLAEDDRRMVVFELHRTYGGPLSAAQRSARYRAGVTSQTRDESATESSRKSDAARHAPVTREREVLVLASRSKGSSEETGSKALVTTAGDSFDEWWSLYPRKKARPKAQLAYAKALAKIDATGLLAALRSQRPDMIARIARGEAQYVPHPTTWLNGERWNDEPDAHGIPAGALPAKVEASLPAIQRFVERRSEG